MKVIRFELEGLLNSFRIPFFRTYHKTFLAPPKTTIIGMLCNIALKPQKEFFEILNKNLIEVSVVIDEICGKTKDLWNYKTLKKSETMGSSVIRRDKLFLSKYTVYIYIKEQMLFDDIFESLKNPKNTPSLGLDDELAIIKNVEILDNLTLNDSDMINSVFLNKGYKYKAFIKDKEKCLELPTPNLTPIKFVAFDNKGNRISKETIEEYPQVEYINCEIKIDNIESYMDKNTNNRLVFY